MNGYKISRSDPLHRIVIGRIYHHTVKLLFGLKVRDVDCDFRLMRRSIFDTRAPREEQRRHLPGDDEEDHRTPASASPRCRSTTTIAPTASRSSSTSARLYQTAIDVMKLWFALVIRREHMATPTRVCRPSVDGASEDRP